MPNVANTLYPPSIPTFQPAFVCTQSVKVLFSLSPFNTNVTELTKVQVSVVDLATNSNALSDARGIIFRQLLFDDASGQYYVTISPTDLRIDNSENVGANRAFKTNQYYKVQIRFDNSSTTIEEYNAMTGAAKQEYLLNQQEYFSEWSSVTLIRAILEPHVALREFDSPETDEAPHFNRGILPIVGSVSWLDANGVAKSTETDALQYYELEIWNSDASEMLLSSGRIFTGDLANPNEINYRFDAQEMGVVSDTEFTLRFVGTTRNQYVWTQDWPFLMFEYMEEPNFDPVITVDTNNDEGYAKVRVQNDKVVYGTLYIKRSDNLSDFKRWEDIQVIRIGYPGEFEGALDYEFIDRTIGSMVWYRYSVQLELQGSNNSTTLTQLYRSDKFLADFYDLFLVRGNRQVAIRFNYAISSLKPVVSRTKFDTLGGKYPKFAENAVMDYKQLSISGLISAQEDKNQEFLNKREHFGDQYNSYTYYNRYYPDKFYSSEEEEEPVERWKYIPEEYDYFWEREFREELIKWLNDGEPKLYKSKTEGSMVVMLTDVNLTPNATLSRMIWNFTATVYEVADATSLETLASLGIIDPYEKYDEGAGGDLKPGQDPTITKEVPGQLFELTPKTVNNVITNIIQPRLENRYGGYLEDMNPSNLSLRNVRVFFHSKPHLFLPATNEGANILALVTETDFGKLSQAQKDKLVMGHMLTLNGKTIFVKQGYYQVPNYMAVTELSFPQGDLTVRNPNNTDIVYNRRDNVTVEYILNYDETQHLKDYPTSVSIEKTFVAQLRDVFDYEDYLFARIKRKHTFVKENDYKIELQYWRGICVDVDPYAIVSIKYHGDDTYSDYMVGPTGVLHMLKDTPADNICFKGRKMFKMPIDRQPYLKEYEYCMDESGQEYENYLDVPDPLYNVVYSVNGELLLHYVNDGWYEFDATTEVAKVPIEGCLNYYATTYRSVY